MVQAAGATWGCPGEGAATSWPGQRWDSVTWMRTPGEPSTGEDGLAKGRRCCTAGSCTASCCKQFSGEPFNGKPFNGKPCSGSGKPCSGRQTSGKECTGNECSGEQCSGMPSSDEHGHDEHNIPEPGLSDTVWTPGQRHPGANGGAIGKKVSGLKPRYGHDLRAHSPTMRPRSRGPWRKQRSPPSLVFTGPYRCC